MWRELHALVAHERTWFDCLEAKAAFLAADKIIILCVHLAKKAELRFILKKYNETKT